MKYVIVKDGGEGPLAMATAYVESLGIPRHQVRRITVDGEVGQPLIVTVELFVPAPDKSHYGRGHDFQDAGDGLCAVCDMAHD